MEEQKNKYQDIKKSMDDFSDWLDETLDDSKKFTGKQKVELIQRPAFDLGLNDGWVVHIDIVVMGVCKRFATVYGKDKFEAKLNASAICNINDI